MMPTELTVLLGCNATEDANAGVAGTVLEVGAALAARGWNPHYQFADPDIDPRRERQMAYVRSLTKSYRVKPKAAIIASGDGALFPLLRPRLPLIVHSHGLEHMARAAAEQHHLPHTFGAGHRYIREPAVAFASRRADALVVQTVPQAEYAVSEYGARPDRVHVIPNAVDSTFFDIAPAAGSRPTVVWIGSWLPRKGTQWLPEILTELRRRVPDVLLHLIGTGTNEDAVREAFDPGIQGSIAVTPRASRDELRAALSEAHVGLFTSVFEGFGRAPLEMAAGGLPLVSTPAGVSADIVRDDRTGRLIEYGDAGSAADSVAHYLTNSTAAAAQGQAARAAARRYDWAIVGDEWDQLLRSVTR